MNKKYTKKGSALAYALVIIFVVSIIFTSMIGYITSQIKFSFNRVEKEKAFQIAEAGIYYYQWYLAHQTDGKTAQQITSFWQNENPLGVNTPYEVDYEGIGKYEIEVQAPSPGSTIVEVQSSGWTYKSPSIVRTVKVRFRRPSWSEYMFLTDSFINFGTGADVYGKVHSNTGIRFDGIAHNVVSSLPASFDDTTHGGGLEFGVHTHRAPVDPLAPAYPWAEGTVPSRPDIFEAGREFPVAQVSFNGVISDLANMKAEAMAGNGDYFGNTGEGRRIILKSNGTYDICTVDTFHHVNFSISKYLKNSGVGTCNSCSGDCISNHPIPDDGIIFVEDNAWVEGNVDAKNISIVAANLSGGGAQADIYIGMDNLRYANYDCDNIVGLIAQRDVTVVKDCPDDFTIDAALIAQTGRVGISSNMASKDVLTFNGAIASYGQPFFAHGTSGFAVRFYTYDNNLLYCPPPYFPTGTEYSLDLWDEL
jgi:hypothetical protein